MHGIKSSLQVEKLCSSLHEKQCHANYHSEQTLSYLSQVKIKVSKINTADHILVLSGILES